MKLPDSFALTGRRALVTGSSRGIGAAIAVALAEAGADVVVHHTGNAAQADEVAARVVAAGRRAAVARADLADAEAPAIIHEAARKAFGGIDILVLNASMQTKKAWTDFTREEIDHHYAVNYRASLRLMQLCVPAMSAAGWGRVLTVGSVQELRPHPEMLPYSSLKHAQTALSTGLARPLAASGVTFNNLAPGVILTDRNSEALSDADYAAKVRAAVPAGFFGESADCVGAALLLCSDAGRYITGQNLFVDGGLGLA